MYLSFLKCTLVVFLLLSVSGLHAQYSTLSVDKHDKVIKFTTSRGSISQPDTITMSEGRYGGRYAIWYEGPGRHFFKVVSPTEKWIKMKKHTEVKVLLVFAPPASFKGETNAKLYISAPSGMRAWITLVGTSTD